MAKTKSTDPFAALRKAGTNGDNYDISTAKIISRLKKWEKLSSFRLSGIDYNAVTITFTSLPKDIKSFVADAFDLCPDLVQVDEDFELPALEKSIAKSKKLKLWWD